MWKWRRCGDCWIVSDMSDCGYLRSNIVSRASATPHPWATLVAALLVILQAPVSPTAGIAEKLAAIGQGYSLTNPPDNTLYCRFEKKSGALRDDATRRLLTLAAEQCLGSPNSAATPERVGRACELVEEARGCGNAATEAVFAAIAGRAWFLAGDWPLAAPDLQRAEAVANALPRRVAAMAEECYLRYGMAADALRLYKAWQPAAPADILVLVQR